LKIHTEKTISIKTYSILAILISLLFQLRVFAQEDNKIEELAQISLEELMQMKVTSASGAEELIKDAPAAMIVITDDEIKKRGYISLSDILMDLPGFDISVTNGADYMVAYQRGYRTSYTQRTLLMIDGKVENHLWSHIAHISRQYPLSNVKKIEVLYGPASAVYGANAFLGIINVITNDGKELKNGDVSTDVSFQAGSFNTKGIDFGIRMKVDDVSYALSVRGFRSDEPDLSDQWGFLSNKMYNNRDFWGPILDIESNGNKLGEYYDPTDDFGLTGSIGYKGLK